MELDKFSAIDQSEIETSEQQYFVAEDDDERHVQRPTGEVVGAHFGRAHAVEEELQVPRHARHRAEDPVGGQRHGRPAPP